MALSKQDELHSLHQFGATVFDFKRGWVKRGLAFKGLAEPEEVHSWVGLYNLLEQKYPSRFGLHIRKCATELYDGAEYIHGYDLHLYRIDRLRKQN